MDDNPATALSAVAIKKLLAAYVNPAAVPLTPSMLFPSARVVKTLLYLSMALKAVRRTSRGLAASYQYFLISLKKVQDYLISLMCLSPASFQHFLLIL